MCVKECILLVMVGGRELGILIKMVEVVYFFFYKNILELKLEGSRVDVDGWVGVKIKIMGDK